MDIERLIEELEKVGILEEIQRKRLTTSEMPASLYIKLVAASIATKKNLSGVIATALETYAMRNQDKHFDELRLQAAASGKSLEQYLVEVIATRLQKKGDEV
ncbi:hypothetical protein I8748_32120 [Nostoc sp. CENA67]|uniref:Uncharacterized protein n=1 Tax=Amazonocrinis nigriterrae CENA67 TaxID=2794033 RepID=A0A8J7LCQ8_9NOST|nr:hypothetical protein [Amazonocrinis nigriterrae]MBH8566746.1 hypothetical protein [Amazonocrinis nigriterrae CENA67]